MQETLHTFLTETRAARLEEERKSAVRQRFAELDEAITAHCVTLPRNAIMDCRPVALDLALLKELEPIANAPAAEAVTRETFVDIVPQLVDNWHNEQRQFLRTLFGRFIRRVPPGVDILDLAVSVVYTKSNCGVQVMHYPHMLADEWFRSAGGRCQEDFPSTHYAAVAADTYSSELGILSKSKPRLITTLNTVPPGTNGGVTAAGVLAGALGAFTIGITSFLGVTFPIFEVDD